MKATFLSKIMAAFLFCMLLNSCTADEAPAQENIPVAEGGPVIPPGPKP